ncbi:MAG TPA: ECF-type sigma factor [Chthoniobacteraceae bacterium]|jgi:RNA polymerase sigma-70 factor (ECF subfamily)|nr:ECF-type sigma factor [Chthoniobacteraceae bacterium]
MPLDDSTPREGHVFATTRWSVVLGARDGSPAGDDALAKLCRTYWYPLYAFVRRQGHGAHDAQDLTQGFFARLLEKKDLAAVDRSKGKFRSFLLASMKHFLANEWDRARAQKRGGGLALISIDDAEAEGRYAHEAAEQSTAEQLFDRRWALTLLDQVLARLEAEMAAAGKRATFDALKFSLTGGQAAAYEEIAHRLGTTEGALKVAIHRLRDRYRTLLREEIADTVGSAADVDEELRHLFSALSV